MKVATLVDHYMSHGVPRPAVILLDTEEEIGCLVGALCLYSFCYAQDPHDDTETGHPASRMASMLIDQLGDGAEKDLRFDWKRDEAMIAAFRQHLGLPPADQSGTGWDGEIVEGPLS